MTVDPPLQQPPLLEPLPLTIGVYYNQDFKNYTHHQSVRGEQWQNSWDIELGSASVKMFDLILPAMLDAVAVSDFPSLDQSPEDFADVVAIVEPSIENFYLVDPGSPRMGFPPPLIKYTASISYRLTLYSPEGNVIVSKVYKGKGQLQHTHVSDALSTWVKSIYSDVIKQAMREAAANILLDQQLQSSLQGLMSSNAYQKKVAP